MSSLASLPQPSAFVTMEFRDIEMKARAAGWELPTNLRKAHPSRQTEWLASRLCLSQAFRELGIELETTKIRFSSHQTIEKMPDFKFSFSHTRDRASVWLLEQRSGALTLGIGLDLESSARRISSSVAKRLNLSSRFGETELERWCLREAIFKSLTETQQLSFTKATVDLNRIGSFQVGDFELEGSYHFEKRKDFLAAFAWFTIGSK